MAEDIIARALALQAKKAAEEGSLPAVTPSDNGKVLGVVDGAWAATEDDFVVTFTKSGSTWSADKNTADIATALSEKKRVYGKAAANLVTSDSTFTNQTFLLPLMASHASFGAETGFPFCGTFQTATKTLFVNIVVKLVPPLNQAVTAYIEEVSLPELPTVTTPDDEYKVLTAYDGAWLKAQACLTVIYSITGLPVDGVYPLSASLALADILFALNHDANVRAKLTVGGDTTIMSPASIGANYVSFSNVVYYNNALCVFKVEHYLDGNDDEVCTGQIIPLNTSVMTYDSSTNTLAITQ